MQAILTNYRTTIIGCALALATVYAHGGFDHLTGPQALQAAMACLLGVLCKDAHATPPAP